MDNFFSKLIQLILASSFIYFVSSSSVCEPGYKKTSSECIPCLGGYYSSELDSSSCYSCPAGT